MNLVKSEEYKIEIKRIARELREAKCPEHGYALEDAAQCLEAAIEEIKLWETMEAL